MIVALLIARYSGGKKQLHLPRLRRAGTTQLDAITDDTPTQHPEDRIIDFARRRYGLEVVEPEDEDIEPRLKRVPEPGPRWNLALYFYQLSSGYHLELSAELQPGDWWVDIDDRRARENLDPDIKQLMDGILPLR